MHVIRITALCALAVVALSSSSVRADSAAEPSTPPPGADAGAIVALVQAFYDQTSTFEAHFEQSRFTRIYDRHDRASGKVVFKKPGKMRFDYAKPNGQVFVADGKQLRIYQPPEEGERHGQVIQRPMADDQLPGAFAFLTGTGTLQDNFDFRLLDAKKAGFADGHVLQLLPKEDTPLYEQVVLFTRTIKTKAGKAAAVVQRVLIIDAAGNRNRFDFSKMKFNRKISESRFSYKPPKGTRIVKP